MRVVPLLLVLTAAAVMPIGGANGSCAGPQLRVGMGGEGPPTVRIGSIVTVQGEHFVHGCNDTGGGSVLGCSTDEGEIEAPMEDVTLTIRQGRQKWDLGTRDAGAAADNKLGQVAWEVTIPESLRPGPAILVADGVKEKIAIGKRLERESSDR
jgi:hypothetical protein